MPFLAFLRVFLHRNFGDSLQARFFQIILVHYILSGRCMYPRNVHSLVNFDPEAYNMYVTLRGVREAFLSLITGSC